MVDYGGAQEIPKPKPSINHKTPSTPLHSMSGEALIRTNCGSTALQSRPFINNQRNLYILTIYSHYVLWNAWKIGLE